MFGASRSMIGTEDAAALTDGEEDDGEETEDLGSGVQKKPAAGWCKAERERRASRAYHRTKTMVKNKCLPKDKLHELLSTVFHRAAARYDQGLSDEFPKLR